MAIATDLARRRGPQRAARGIATSDDRSHAFRTARRHTRVVRALRVILPAVCVASVCFYALAVMRASGWGGQFAQLPIPRITPENLTMVEPRYHGFNSDGGSYVLKADSAVQDLKTPNLVKLNQITGELLDAKRSKTNLRATFGIFDQSKNELELSDGIDVVSESGMHAQLKSATVFPKTSLIVSKEPVVVEMPTGTVRSKEMTLRHKLKEATFLDSVEAHLKARAKSESDAKAAAAADAKSSSDKTQTPAASGGQRMFGSSNSPIDVKSSRLDINDRDKIAIFTGDVRAVQDDTTLTTPELQVFYEGDADPVGQPAASEQQGTRLRRVLAKQPVVITRGTRDQVTSSGADFDAATEIAHLTGDVVMTSGADRRVVGDTAEFDQRADTVLVLGKVVVTQGRNELKGRRMFVERKLGKTLLTSPAEGGMPAGRITARFYQTTSKAADGAKRSPEQSPQPSATPLGLGPTTFKTDPNAPIDVEAESLEVNDPTKVAVFRGDVRAVQGDFHVRTVELHAHYTGQAGIAEIGSDTGARAPAQVTRLEARQKVVIVSKDNQTATGDWADFDVKTNMATVGGDVLVTRGRDVVRGTRLLIDMTTGESTIVTDHQDGWAATAADPNANKESASQPVFTRDRPSAVFYPKQAKEGKAATDTPKPKPEAKPKDEAAAPAWVPPPAPGEHVLRPN